MTPKAIILICIGAFIGLALICFGIAAVISLGEKTKKYGIIYLSRHNHERYKVVIAKSPKQAEQKIYKDEPYALVQKITEL